MTLLKIVGSIAVQRGGKELGTRPFSFKTNASISLFESFSQVKQHKGILYFLYCVVESVNTMKFHICHDVTIRT